MECSPAFHVEFHLIRPEHSGAVSSESFHVSDGDVLVHNRICFLGRVNVRQSDDAVRLAAVERK